MILSTLAIKQLQQFCEEPFDDQNGKLSDVIIKNAGHRILQQRSLCGNTTLKHLSQLCHRRPADLSQQELKVIQAQ